MNNKNKQMTIYDGSKVEFSNCPGCDYANHLFSLPCKMVYENNLITISQDWELPIDGFQVISPKRHVEKFTDLTHEEQTLILNMTNRLLSALREMKIAEEFNVIFEEKAGTHLHFWIMPRHDWMTKNFGSPTKHIAEIFEYAKQNFRTQEHIEKINQTNKNLKDILNRENYGNIKK